MKDEEMAEEYFESSCLHSYADTEEELKEDVEEAFLAGLKAGRPQWHKVADGDLPNDRHEHVVLNQDWDKVIFRNGGFEYLDGCKSAVIAWCELPTFDKE